MATGLTRPSDEAGSAPGCDCAPCRCDPDCGNAPDCHGADCHCGARPFCPASGAREDFRSRAARAPSADTSPSSFGNSSVSVTRTSGPNSVDSDGLARPVCRDTTSRSTPVSCSAISCAEANRRAGSGSVERTRRR